jgi:predicted transcriptional regulator of viral defense system
MRTNATDSKSVASGEFFDGTPVFTRAEFEAARTETARRSPRTTDSLLRRYVADGRLLRVRAGLYAVVPRGAEAATAPVDPYLVATKLAPDATLAYHAALQFWGKAYSVWQRFHFVTETSTRALRFRGLEFVPVKVPLPLRQLPMSERHVAEQRHAGGTVRVTTLERTLVDVLDAPGNGGGWEEVWRSLEMVEFFDLDAVISYTVKLQSALTAARVGFFLEQHREALMVEDKHLDQLRRLRPRQPRYLDARRKPGKLVASWNLIVPDEVLGRTWADVA